MKITKQKLKRIIKEEMSVVLKEGLHYEGLMETIADALRAEIGSWHQEAKDEALAEFQEKGFDLTELTLTLLSRGK